MAKKNGWRRTALIATAVAFTATTIVAFGGAATVLESYWPWAPRHTFALAAENTIDRWRTDLLKVKFLAEQAKNAGDRVSQASWEKQLLEIQQKINELLVEKAQRR